MTEIERTLCQRLRACCSLTTDEQITEFVEVMRQFPVSDDPEVLRQMLTCLNDVDAGEVQYELVEACERFPNEVYVPEVMKLAPTLLRQAGNWGRLVVQSMLNNKDCLSIAQKDFALLNPEERAQFQKVLDAISASDSRYEPVRKLFQ